MDLQIGDVVFFTLSGMFFLFGRRQLTVQRIQFEEASFW